MHRLQDSFAEQTGVKGLRHADVEPADTINVSSDPSKYRIQN